MSVRVFACVCLCVCAREFVRVSAHWKRAWAAQLNRNTNASFRPSPSGVSVGAGRNPKRRSQQCVRCATPKRADDCRPSFHCFERAPPLLTEPFVIRIIVDARRRPPLQVRRIDSSGSDSASASACADSSPSSGLSPSRGDGGGGFALLRAALGASFLQAGARLAPVANAAAPGRGPLPALRLVATWRRRVRRLRAQVRRKRVQRD